MVPTLCCNFEEKCRKFSYTSKCSHKSESDFKELIGTLAKVQGIFHVFELKNVALIVYLVVTPFAYLKWNILYIYT